MRAQIMILNYNGGELLSQTLPTIQEAMTRSRHTIQWSLIDNESTDDSVQLVKRLYPDLRIIHCRNQVLCSYNEVVKNIDDDVVVLLNNDIRVDSDFLDGLLNPFEKDTQLFLVAPKVMTYDGREVMGGVCQARFRFGLLWVSDREAITMSTKESNQPLPTFAAGAALAVHREKFIELGGYDELYLPGTLEDVDLCFRAWKMGYRCLYEPRSIAYHKGQMSFRRRFGKRGILKINARNNFLFIWKNFNDKGYWLEHLFFLIPRCLWAFVTGRFYWLAGFFSAFAKIPEVFYRREMLRALRKTQRSERQVLAQWA